MSRTIQSYTVEGLQRRLLEMEREIRDLKRIGSWNFDREYEVAGGSGATSNGAALLVVTASADPIASGGDFVSFDTTIHRHGFAAIAVGAQAIIWPRTAVGEIQVEFSWLSYTGGGKIEIEVDGVVPAWGLIADAAGGSTGCKRRSVHIEAGAEVAVRVTQTSGSPQTADVLVEFAIPDPTLTLQNGDLVETVWLETLNNGSAASAAALSAGGVYRFVIEGNYDVNTSTGVTSGVSVIYPSTSDTGDALRDAEWEVGDAHITLFTIDLGSGASHIEPVGGPYSTPQPYYEYIVTGEGSVVSFAHGDAPTLSDNNGRFKIEIYEL